MRLRQLFLIISLAAVTMQLALAQGLNMTFPRVFKAGNSFSIQSSGNGKATLYIIGPGQVLKRDVQ